MNKTQLEALVNDENLNPSAEMLRAALAKRDAKLREQKEMALVEVFDIINKSTKDLVASLRRARAHERMVAAQLAKYATAEENFKNTGDVKEYAFAIYGEETCQARLFLQRFAVLVNGDSE